MVDNCDKMRGQWRACGCVLPIIVVALICMNEG